MVLLLQGWNHARTWSETGKLDFLNTFVYITRSSTRAQGFWLTILYENHDCGRENGGVYLHKISIWINQTGWNEGTRKYGDVNKTGPIRLLWRYFVLQDPICTVYDGQKTYLFL